MALSNDLKTMFAKITNDQPETKKESTVYGTIVKDGDNTCVQLDGSDLLTPISTTTVVNNGDRVIVTIKNHTAIVTGDLTNPSANDKDVQEFGKKISDFEIVIADKVTTEQLEAEVARIDKLIADDITATNAKFETIDAKVAEIDTIKADVVEVSGKISAHEAEFTTLRADIADFKDVTTESIDAIEGNFHTLESDYADFKVVTTNKITANEGSITELETKKLDTETANITFANIDFSNIKEAAIEKLFTDSGIIKDLIMSDGKVTGELVGVTIKGDLIEGNTIKADKLVIKGEDGIYYKLNVDALGETTASSDEKYQNGLDGTVIIAESITAEKIAVDDLVAFGATIGGFHIDDHALYSGVKSSIDNTTNGIYLGDDGQIAIGGSNNYFKFYKDSNNNYLLEIQANSIKFGTSKKSIEEAINEVSGDVTTLRTDLSTTQGTVNTINGEVNTLKTDLNTTQGDVETLQTDLTTTQETVNSALENTVVNATEISSLEIKTDGITASVADIKVTQDTNSNSIETLNNDLSELTKSVNTKMDADSVDIAITSALQNGVSKVSTTTGFTFDENGLTVSKSGSEMKTTIDEDGMTIKRGEDEQLVANNEGVIAYDLHAKTYLIVGTNSRFEDYDKDGTKQTGCFWIGDTEV